MTSHSATLQFSVPGPCEFPLIVRGHGWYDLEPNAWCAESERLDTAFSLAGQVFSCRLGARQGRIRVVVTSTRPLEATTRAALRAAVLRMLRFDEDFEDFWTICRGQPERRWVAERGAGRLLRSVSLFEDLLKILFTTNCSWSATRSMTANLVALEGPVAPDGRRAFPSAAALVDRDESFWRDRIRVGYRARAACELVQRCADGSLDEARLKNLPTAELRRELRALRGFGPYAAGQALRLLGRYDDLALDSWCRAGLAQLGGPGGATSESELARRYAPFGTWAGLALWLDLTRDWHR
ncbi:MAG: Fe-S cluster assembly protein HesB [Planctomycetes bacterium]|nr:Fe-S cluster assembly protein HesB [Planctomycetota bacterium]